ncbi:MAG: organic solvent tolerance protein [Rhodobacterales bacterium]|nr:MAG: organic solvent tolerance protein [Rhodobacterales bacterium]
MRLIRFPVLSLLALGLLPPLPAMAQSLSADGAVDGVATGTTGTDAALADPNAPVHLVADSVFLDGETRLVATGNVEALQGETRIRASRITYDRDGDRLTIQGPITITAGDRILVLADQAEMDPQFRNGLLTGARMVLDQQVQLAALQINRVNGRYSQLYKASVTTCRLCKPGAQPIWQIRAQKVIHDQQERQLYFHNAQFRVFDMPVMYFPRLRLPDPTLKRATGFLIPSISQNSLLGIGVKLPYFIRIGDHKDLTVTPYLAQHTRTLNLRYRQAFRTGNITFEGGISEDDLKPGETRGSLYGEGAFELGNDFRLTFDVELASDDSYLVDYGFGAKDRLDSEIAVTRVRRDSYFRAGLVHYHSMRVGEDASTLPTLIGDVTYERRFFPKRLGGELRASAGLHSHYRFSSTDTLGRDVTRAEAELNWQRHWTLTGGLRLGFETGLALDQISTSQDSTVFPSSITRATPMAALHLRYPWVKHGANGSSHVIEPVVQLAYVGGSRVAAANDESTRVEFDEGNLIALSRYPAHDRRERGGSAAVGVSWTQFTARGWQSNLTFGQVIRDTSDADFSASSGLGGTRSDLLVAGQIKSPDGLAITARALYSSGLDLNKAEGRATWDNDRISLDASYIWLGPDPAENRTNTVSEWVVDGTYRLSRHWNGSANIRYDVASSKTSEAGVGLQYRNECVALDLSLSRRFTSSTILTPSTDVSLTVGLQGFSAKSAGKSYVRTCGN